MAINLTIDTSGLDQLQVTLARLTGQMPFAVSQALNKTGFDVRKALSEGTRRHFDNPTTFTEKAFIVQRGNKQDPTVLVGAQANRPYFVPQIRGGRRYPKEFEGYIRGLGKGAVSGKLVPTSLAMDARGNPKKSLFGQIARGLSTTNRGGFFIGKPKGGGRPAGVYRRSREQLFPYFIETRSEPRYQPRFPMEKIGQDTINRVAGGYLRTSIARALATAR